jgi:hypothetical protein
MFRHEPLKVFIAATILFAGFGCGGQQEDDQQETGIVTESDGGDVSTDAEADASICTPESCLSLNLACGTHSNTCGGTIDCGTCDRERDECVDGTCECDPLSCGDIEAECGVHPDGCGRMLSCPGCPIDGEECVDGTCE